MLYSIFTDDIGLNIDLIERIKSFLQKQYDSMDFVIFTDNISYSASNHSVLTTFYMIAYKGITIFLDIDDYFAYRDGTNGKCIVYLTKEDISDIDQNSIRGCGILTETNNELEWIKRYELQ